MRQLRVVEVSPRDGLQNESAPPPTEAKVELIARLVSAGARRIEVVSFAHPKLVSAMADAEAVMAQVPRGDGVSYAGLVLNHRGLDRAADAGAHGLFTTVTLATTFLHGGAMGFRTGVDLHSLLPIAGFLTDRLGHQVPAMLPKAGPFP
jgi:hydroxymethylglutaryl-CoA lyase